MITGSLSDLENEDVPVLTWPQQSPQEEPLLTEYYLKAEGKNTAHKIVSVIGQLSPHITYSPGLLPLVDLFLHYMDAADCFSCVLTLLQSNNPAYLMQSRVAFEASKHVLRDLTKKYAVSAVLVVFLVVVVPGELVSLSWCCFVCRVRNFAILFLLTHDLCILKAILSNILMVGMSLLCVVCV